MNKKHLVIMLIMFIALTFTAVNIISASDTTKGESVLLNPVENGKEEIAKEGDITEGTLKGRTDKGEEIVCPLKHTDVKAEISGFISSVEVTQEFTNPINTPIEATYIFPLPHNGAVNSMEMKVGERTILGLIKTKEEARKIYEQEKAAGHLTGLLEQERPNIFSQSVANIKPGDSIFVKIKYVDILDYDKGTYNFHFPMVVGPRFNPPSVKDAEKITPEYLKPGERSGHDISLSVNLNAGVPIKEIRSKSHKVLLQTEGQSKAFIKIKEEDSIPNKDFIIEYDVAGDMPECAAITTGNNGNGYFTLMIQPKAEYKEEEITAKEMVFVLDCSGSMSGIPMETSKATIRKCVEYMNKNDTFQIINFSMSASGLSDKPLTNTPENIKKGLAYIDTLSGEGGTNMIEGIKAALNAPRDRERMRIVFFLTDGYIGNETEILAEIEKNIGNARLFSLGVGSSVNRYLLDNMSEAGRGHVQYMRPKEEPKAVVEEFYERISKPYFTDISIDWKGCKVDDIYPKRIPDLFSSQPLFIYGRYTQPGSGTVEITGNIAGKKTVFPVKVEFPEKNEANSALSSIWARQKIKDLENRQYGGPKGDLINQITALALEFRLMSTYTSFVAVEESYQVDPNGERKSILVPVEMPESVSYEGVFGKEKKDKALYNLPASTLSTGVDYTCAAPQPSYSECLKTEEAEGYIAPDGKPVSTADQNQKPSFSSVISINTENLKFSAKNSVELETTFDFSSYLKNSEEKKSFTKVQIFKSGELLGEITSLDGKTGIIPSDKDKNTIILSFLEGKSPFVTSGEYTLIIEVYNENGTVIARGADTVTLE